MWGPASCGPWQCQHSCHGASGATEVVGRPSCSHSGQAGRPTARPEEPRGAEHKVGRKEGPPQAGPCPTRGRRTGPTGSRLRRAPEPRGASRCLSSEPLLPLPLIRAAAAHQIRAAPAGACRAPPIRAPKMPPPHTHTRWASVTPLTVMPLALRKAAGSRRASAGAAGAVRVRPRGPAAVGATADASAGSCGDVAPSLGAGCCPFPLWPWLRGPWRQATRAHGTSKPPQ